MTRLLLFVVLVVGCGGQTPADDGLGTGTPDSMLPPPQTRPGEFAFRTRTVNTDYMLASVATIRAIRCELTGSLQLFQYEPNFAIGFHMGLDSGNVSGVYDVVRKKEEIPGPGTARMALQIYPDDQSFSFAGVRGTIQVDSMTSALFGSFSVNAFENVMLDSILVDGVFNGLEIVDGEGAVCRVLGEPPDSLLGGP